MLVINDLVIAFARDSFIVARSVVRQSHRLTTPQISQALLASTANFVFPSFTNPTTQPFELCCLQFVVP